VSVQSRSHACSSSGLRLLLTAFVTGLGFAFTPAAAQEALVPVDHPVVAFLRRLETRGFSLGLDETTLPLMRSDVRDALIRLLEAAERSSGLSQVERAELSIFAAEFVPDRAPDAASPPSRAHRVLSRLARRWSALGSLYQNGFDLLEHREGPLLLRFNPLVRMGYDRQVADTIDGTRIVRTERHGFSVVGDVAGRIGFYFAFTDGREWGGGPYLRRQNITAPGLGFASGYGSYLEHDETEAVITARAGLLSFLYGKTVDRWGPGRFGQLALSGRGASFDQLQLRFRARRLRYAWFYGFLRHYIDPTEKKAPNPIKAIAGHRATLLVCPWLDVSLHETVVFSRRRWELAYLNPVMFLRSAEHFLGDEDNATMGAAIELRPLRGIEIYGELFLDDLCTSKIGTGWYGDKWAYLLGAHLAFPIRSTDVDLRLEYARIRPYVYSHKDSVLAYQHFITLLGHPAGPNSDQWDLALRLRPHWRLALTLRASYRRHGANPPGLNLGGDWRRGHVYGDPLYVPFLSGLREHQRGFSVRVQYHLAYQLALELSWEFARGTAAPGSAEEVSRNAIFAGFSLDYPGLPH